MVLLFSPFFKVSNPDIDPIELFHYFCTVCANVVVKGAKGKVVFAENYGFI